MEVDVPVQQVPGAGDPEQSAACSMSVPTIRGAASG